MRAKPDDGDHLAGQNQIDLLKNFGWAFAGHDGSMAIGALDAMQVDEIDFVIRKGLAFVQFMGPAVRRVFVCCRLWVDLWAS